MMSGQPYRELLQSRGGRGISEAEAKHLVEQVLTQLIPLHQTGQAHGNISLDTLLRQGTNTILAPGIEESFSRPIDDIYQLGTTLLTLLTTRSPQSLRQPDGSWNWQDDCLVSDQLATLIEGSIAPEEQRFENAMLMQTAIRSPMAYIPPTIVFPVPQTVVSILPERYSPPQYQSTPTQYAQSLSSQESSSRPPWFWGVVGGGVTVLVGLLGLGLLKMTDKSIESTSTSISSTTSTTSNSSSSSTPEPTPVSTPNPFDRGSFPKSSCGDAMPTNPSAYPVSFYPIFVSISDANLRTAQSQFCRDSLAVTRTDTGRKAIQISSFTNRDKAMQFRDYVGRSIGDAEVGPPTIVEKPR